MSDEKVLTKENFEKFLADPQSVDLSQFTGLDKELFEGDAFHDWHSKVTYIDSMSALQFVLSDPFDNYEVHLDGLRYISDEAAELICCLHEDKSVSLSNCAMSEQARSKLTSRFDDAAGSWFAEEMPKEVAHYWATTEDGDLSGYGMLSLEAAEILASAEKEDWRNAPSLYLPDVAYVGPEVARRLAKSNAYLELGLVTLSEDSAAELSKYSGPYLDLQVTHLSDSAAMSLSKSSSTTLTCGYLCSMPPSAGFVSLAKRLAKDNDDIELSIGNLEDAIVEALIEQQGSEGETASIVFSDLKNLSATAARILCSHAACKAPGRDGVGIEFNALTQLSDDAARYLVEYPGHLYLELDDLPDSAAAILRKHPSFADED